MVSSIAAVMSDSGKSLSHADLQHQSIQLANLLRASGLGDGDRVAIIMENRLDWFIAIWGVRRANMYLVPINWHLKLDEVQYVLENCDAKALITSETLVDLAASASSNLPKIGVKLSTGPTSNGFDNLSETLNGYPVEPGQAEIDGGLMMYSSGTTGKPKGILAPLTGRPFDGPNPQEQMLAETYSLSADTVYLSPAPMYHAAPIKFCSAVVHQGGTVIMMPSFDADASLAAIDRYKVTCAQMVPTHFVRMLRLPDEDRTRHDLSTMKMLIHAAAPCPPDVKRAMIEWLGPIVVEFYAGSESCGMTFIDSHEWLAHPGSVGRSRTSPIHIVDIETGKELPVGQIGAIYFESPPAFVYHKDEQKTAGIFTKEGWGTLGDIGHLDEEGYLYLSDRRTDLILSGGVNIYPQEIENVLSSHPAVADVGVIGIPSAEFGQEVKAVVQLIEGLAQTPSEADLIAYVRDHLAHFKAPRSVDFTTSLPRLPNGKLLRRNLIEQYTEAATKSASSSNR